MASSKSSMPSLLLGGDGDTITVSPPHSSGMSPFSASCCLTRSGLEFASIDLVDGDDDRNVGRLGVRDGFTCLRHNAVIGSHDQDDDIRSLGTAGADGGEGGMAGGVEEGDLPTLELDLVRTDVLGDAPGFPAVTSACRMASRRVVSP